MFWRISHASSNARRELSTPTSRCCSTNAITEDTTIDTGSLVGLESDPAYSLAEIMRLLVYRLHFHGIWEVCTGVLAIRRWTGS